MLNLARRVASRTEVLGLSKAGVVHQSFKMVVHLMRPLLLMSMSRSEDIVMGVGSHGVSILILMVMRTVGAKVTTKTVQ